MSGLHPLHKKQCSHCRVKRGYFKHPYLDKKWLCIEHYHELIHEFKPKYDLTRVHVDTRYSDDERVHFISYLNIPFDQRIQLLEMNGLY